MIILIAAIDSLRGIADDKGIPWDLPTDKEYYRKKIKNEVVLMGRRTYKSHDEPLSNKTNYVLTSSSEPLREGFVAVDDIDTFLSENPTVWVIGGQGVFEAALPYADELYITQVNGMFGCTKFFPSFEGEFTLVSKSKIKKENKTEFQYQVWKANRLASLYDAD